MQNKKNKKNKIILTTKGITTCQTGLENLCRRYIRDNNMEWRVIKEFIEEDEWNERYDRKTTYTIK